MKKTTKSIILGLTAFSSIALSGCTVSQKEDFVIDYTYTTPSGQEVTTEISAQDILDRYLTNDASTATSAYYDAIYEVALREVFTNGRFKDQYATVTSEVNITINQEKSKADNAGTSWEDYLINTLNIVGDNLSVEEREHIYYLQQEVVEMKEIVSDEFYLTFSEWNPEEDTASQDEVNEFNMVYGENGYINTKLPYHVRDILIQVDAAANNYSTGEISSDDATQIYNLLRSLVRTNDTTYTYGDVARQLSDDTTSAEGLGEHLMDLDTSFINEFKLGIYTYESLYKYNETTNTDTQSKIEKFLMPQNVQTNLEDIGITYIPYEAGVKLYEYRNTEKYRDPVTGNELTVNEGNVAYYPRNIYFNKYFNSHNISFIVNRKVDSSDPTNSYIFTDSGATVMSDLNESGNYGMSNEVYFEEGTSEANHFRDVGLKDDNGNPIEVLCDEKGNPIIVSRSETSNAGIHFVVIEKSPLEDQETAEVKLNEYYAPISPITQNGQDSSGNRYTNPDFPTDENGNQLQTYVNGSLTMDVNGYNTRAQTLRSSYESYTGDQKDFQLFQWVTEGNFKAASQTVQEKVDQYIESQMLTVESSADQTLIDSWNSYNEDLLAQEQNRLVGLIPETCAVHFGESEYYGVGGLCYYTTSLNPGSSNDNN